MRHRALKALLALSAAAGGVVAWQRRNETPPTPPEGMPTRLRPAEPFMDPMLDRDPEPEPSAAPHAEAAAAPEPAAAPVRESTPTPGGEPTIAIDEAVQVTREDRTDVPAAAIPPTTPLPDPPRKPT